MELDTRNKGLHYVHVRALTLASTMGSSPSVNFANFIFTFAPLTRLLSKGSTLDTTLLLMALFSIGHICRTAM